MPRRIRRPADKESVFEALTKGESEVFTTYKDVMMMAACIGYSRKTRKPFDKTLEPISWSIFKDTDAAVINALALAEIDDITILLDTDDSFELKLTILEEYANAGLEVLQREVLRTAGRSLDNILDIVFSASQGSMGHDLLVDLNRLASQLRLCR